MNSVNLMSVKVIHDCILKSEHLAYLGDGWVEWRVEAEVVCPPDDEAKSLELEPRLCLRRLASASWSKEMERSTSGWPWWDEANPGPTLYERRKWNSRSYSPWTHYHSRLFFLPVNSTRCCRRCFKRTERFASLPIVLPTKNTNIKLIQLSCKNIRTP